MYTILIVEDDYDVRENIAEILTENSYEVVTASNGCEGVEKLLMEVPDLIISDILMPEMDGFQLLEFVQNSKKFAHIPFFFLTGNFSTEEIRKGMLKGADDYLPKPFREYELLEMLRIKLNKQELIREQLDSIKEDIALSVPHELRTPLTPILGYSGMLADDAKSLTAEEIEEMASVIKTSTLRLIRSVDKFVLFANIQYELNGISNDESLNSNTTDTIEFLVMKIIKEENNYNKVTINLDINIEESRLKIDEYYFNICVKELVENAFKFSDTNTAIKIIGQNKNNIYELSIENTGGGFAADQINKIDVFNKQYDRTMPGSGLGLPIVKRITEYFGGKLEVVSEEERKKRVTLQIPRVDK
jgi:signal transduction histidine kinase